MSKTVQNNNRLWLGRFSKFVCFGTLFLIFAGGLVTSTGSGLAVPDWPLSYGMLFPPMVGGIFYEHGHRMVAGTIGLLTLILTIWICIVESRRWVRNLAIGALGAVVLQGILGGMTVLFFLPPAISTFHAVLAQTFFILTIIIAYSQSKERETRLEKFSHSGDASFLKLCFFVTFLIYCQLIVGALMRHTNAGLAIPDFPAMGGEMTPRFDTAMLKTINGWRFDMNLSPVTMNQVFIHFAHRVGALIVLCGILIMTIKGLKTCTTPNIRNLIYTIDLALLIQITLGISTVLSRKAVSVTTFHVVTGAALLGLNVLLILRAAPLRIKELQSVST